MKRSLSIISLLLLLCIVIGSLASCDGLFGGETPPPEHVHVDIAGGVKLDMNSETIKVKVKLKEHVDGDTSHFYVPAGASTPGAEVDYNNVLKARYLAINTPESTGKIEEWGGAASKFTKDKLTAAKEFTDGIIIESDGAKFETDGNGRTLVWVWYKTSEDGEYRNLNLDLLQNGLAWGAKAEEGRYGKVALEATSQALEEKLYIFSEDKDPNFPYDAATKISLKELRTNPDEYYDKASDTPLKRIAVDGVVIYNSDYTVYMIDTDVESGITYGIQVFLSYDNDLANMLLPGTRARVVGVLDCYHGTYQITDLRYNAMRPNDPANTALIDKDNPIEYKEITAEQFFSNVTVEMDESTKKEFKFVELALGTPVAMKNLKVIDTYTTNNGGSNDGAITLTCEVDGKTIDVRTDVLKDENGNVVKESYFMGKTIDVKGIMEYFDLNDTGNGNYQIKVNYLKNIVIHD